MATQRVNSSGGKSSSHKSGSSLSIGAGAQFLSDSTEELKKVTWPTKQETIQATIVTMIIMAVVSLCLFFMDYLFGTLMASVLS